MINTQILNEAIDAQGLTALAAKAQMSANVLSLVKVGKYPSQMRPTTKRRLARAVGVPIRDLFPKPGSIDSGPTAS